MNNKQHEIHNLFSLNTLVVFLGIGISSLVEGIKKDESGKRNKEAIKMIQSSTMNIEKIDCWKREIENELFDE